MEFEAAVQQRANQRLNDMILILEVLDSRQMSKKDSGTEK